MPQTHHATIHTAPGLHGATMLRWFAASATMTVPQAAAPVAFSFVALATVGQASHGAAMVLAMTLAQVLGAIPITRMGRKFPVSAVLRVLILFRTAALALIAIGMQSGLSFGVLVGLAALAGLVNGATYGYLRALLNALTSESRMPRALGIAATLNETTFVLGPVLAAGVGAVSPAGAVALMAILGGLPALLVPAAAPADPVEEAGVSGAILSAPIMLWLVCAAAGAASVAAIEIGAVALALDFGYEPALAILFTVPLCLASVSGGLWISIRNRLSSRRAVVIQLALLSGGITLTAAGGTLVTTILGAVIVGLMLAPLGTHYALVLDKLAPPHRRPEVFALLRTSNALGIIFASALLTLLPLHGALLAVTAAMWAATVLVGVRGHRAEPS
ncbi:MFS transporter [Pseudooceanicola sp. LIPI14-2-Ac024]|uniref:MFS transporter n=1 Tax=Pseudooceanicola sp. LIPI14-2-Ac024 TaxID=3344875 RepID=UPI0035D12755